MPTKKLVGKYDEKLRLIIKNSNDIFVLVNEKGEQFFISDVAKKLIGKLPIRVKAPTAVDVVLRRKDNCIIIHLINRSSGLPNSPNAGGIDEIPPVGPVRIRLDLASEPGSIDLMFENGKLKGKFDAKKRGGCLTLKLSKVDVHAAIVIEPAA